MEGLATFPEYMNSLNECCYNKTCLGGFQSLPERLVNFQVTDPVPFLNSRSKFCVECGLPEREIIEDGDLDDACDDHANQAMDCGFKNMYPHHTLRCTIYYKISNRMFRRINRNQACRRNVLNIIVNLPYNNCLVPYHITWPHAPQNH